MKLAEAYVEIIGKDAPLNRTLATTHRNLLGFSGRAGREAGAGLGAGLVAGVTAGLTTAALKVGALTAHWFVSATNSAADLGETIDKTKAILGDAAPTAFAFADEMAAKFGLIKAEVLDTASALGGLGKNLGGLKGKGLEKFTVGMTKLAADFQSLANTKTLDEARQALSVGLSGEQSDVLKRFGVILTETTVKAYALAHGIGAGNKELTEEEKFAARVGIIMQKLSYVHGNLEDTQDSARNQSRKFWGQLHNLSDTIANELLPYLTQLTSAANDFVANFAKGWGENKDRADAFKKSIDETIFVVKNFGTVFEIARLDAAIGIGKIVGLFDQIVAKYDFARAHFLSHPLRFMVDPIGAAAATVQGVMNPKIDMGAWAKDITGQLIGAAMRGLGGPGGKVDKGKFIPKEFGAAAAAAKPLDLGDNDAVRVLREQRAALERLLEKRRTDELAAKGPAAKPQPKPDEAKAAAAAGKPQAGQFFDLAGFAKNLQEKASGKGNEAKVTAESTKKTADEMTLLRRWFAENGMGMNPRWAPPPFTGPA